MKMLRLKKYNLIIDELNIIKVLRSIIMIIILIINNTKNTIKSFIQHSFFLFRVLSFLLSLSL